MHNAGVTFSLYIDIGLHSCTFVQQLAEVIEIKSTVQSGRWCQEKNAYIGKEYNH